MVDTSSGLQRNVLASQLRTCAPASASPPRHQRTSAASSATSERAVLWSPHHGSTSARRRANLSNRSPSADGCQPRSRRRTRYSCRGATPTTLSSKAAAVRGSVRACASGPFSILIAADVAGIGSAAGVTWPVNNGCGNHASEARGRGRTRSSFSPPLDGHKHATRITSMGKPSETVGTAASRLLQPTTATTAVRGVSSAASTSSGRASAARTTIPLTQK
mmetsp:Transcript_10249/g.35818  ORF Transcript_10249/g.35818 Transcript_10249/m.35818 type:complete len:220 (-) Transcript_10249:3432-4091(-)